MNQASYTPPPAQPEAPKRRTWLWIAVALIALCCCAIVFLVAAYYGYDNLGDPLGLYEILNP